MPDRIAQLTREIAELEQTLAMPGLPEAAHNTLKKEIAAKKLQLLRQSDDVTSPMSILAELSLESGQTLNVNVLFETPHGATVSTVELGQEYRLLAVIDHDHFSDLDGVEIEIDGAGIVWPEGTIRLISRQHAIARWSFIPLEGAPLQFWLKARKSQSYDRNDTGTITLAVMRSQTKIRFWLTDYNESCEIDYTPEAFSQLAMSARTRLKEIINIMPRGNQELRTRVEISPRFFEEAKNKFVTLGAELWSALFRSRDANITNFGQNLRTLRQKKGTQITISGDIPFFPWQLLFDGDDRQPKDEDFWGFGNVITIKPPVYPRSLSDTSSLSPSRVLTAYNIVDSSISSHVEQQRLELAKLAVTVHEVTTEVNLISELKKDVFTNVVYIYGHMVTVSSHSSSRSSNGTEFGPGVFQSTLILTNESSGLNYLAMRRELPLDRAPILLGNPLVVVVACKSGAIEPLVADGFLTHLLEQGACAAIGTEVDTPAIFGATFGSKLLHAYVVQGMMAGEALLHVRRQFWSDFRNPLGLLFNFLGDPHGCWPDATL